MRGKICILGIFALAIMTVAGCASTGGGGGASDTDLIANLLDDYGAALQAAGIATAIRGLADDFGRGQGVDKAGRGGLWGWGGGGDERRRK